MNKNSKHKTGGKNVAKPESTNPNNTYAPVLTAPEPDGRIHEVGSARGVQLEYRTYSHPKWGVIHGAHPVAPTNFPAHVWLLLDDVSQLSGRNARDIGDYWSHLTMTDSAGNVYLAGSTIYSIFTRPGDETVDAWLQNDVLTDLLHNRGPKVSSDPGFAPEPAVSALRLHALIARDREFGTWADDLGEIGAVDGPIPEPYLDPQLPHVFGFTIDDVAVPLALALRLAAANRTFTGMLARIPIIEALVGEHCQNALDDELEVCIGLIPDSRHQIDARRLHGFLGVKQFFVPWITSAICDLRMKCGRDYYNFGAEEDRGISCNFNIVRDDFVGVVSVSTQFAKYLAIREPTRRGCLMGRYALGEEEKLNPDPQPFLRRPPTLR